MKTPEGVITNSDPILVSLAYQFRMLGEHFASGCIYLFENLLSRPLSQLSLGVELANAQPKLSLKLLETDRMLS